MAFFKLRWPGQQEPADKPTKRSRPSPADSIEAMRRRARHRLIGAAVLVLLGVVGFPLLFDTQPRPIPVDIPIEIPDRNKVAPLVVPASPVARGTTTPASAAAATPSQNAAATNRAAADASLADGEELLTAGRPAAKRPAGSTPVAAAPTTMAPNPAVSKSESKAVAPAGAPAEKRDDATRARALLEGRANDGSNPASTAAADSRFIVQVGAFAETDKAREVRQKLEKAGLKTYTQVVDTRDGARTRVRVGPFGSRAEADKAADQIKALNLPASILTL